MMYVLILMVISLALIIGEILGAGPTRRSGQVSTKSARTNATCCDIWGEQRQSQRFYANPRLKRELCSSNKTKGFPSETGGGAGLGSQRSRQDRTDHPKRFFSKPPGQVELRQRFRVLRCIKAIYVKGREFALQSCPKGIQEERGTTILQHRHMQYLNRDSLFALVSNKQQTFHCTVSELPRRAAKAQTCEPCVFRCFSLGFLRCPLFRWQFCLSSALCNG